MNEHAHIPCKPTLDHGLSWVNMRPDYSNMYAHDTFCFPSPNNQEYCEANSHNTDEVYVTGLSHHHCETKGCVRNAWHMARNNSTEPFKGHDGGKNLGWAEKNLAWEEVFFFKCFAFSRKTYVEKIFAVPRKMSWVWTNSSCLLYSLQCSILCS